MHTEYKNSESCTVYCYADIAVAIPVDKPYTYAIPEHLRPKAQVGMRAEISLNNRITSGYIVKLKNECDLESPKLIRALPDSYPAFSSEMLDLSRWIADYYCCSWGEALQSAAPAGIKLKNKIRYRLASQYDHTGRFSSKQKLIIAALFKNGVMYEGQLCKTLNIDKLQSTLQSLVARGIIQVEELSAKQHTAIRKELYVQLHPETQLDTESLTRLQKRAPRQASVYLDLLHQGDVQSASSLCSKHHIQRATLQAMKSHKLIVFHEKEFYRSPDMYQGKHAVDKFELNDEQHTALQAIINTVNLNRFQTFLLQGVTGSGKTEVYLQAIEHVLMLGKNAIILVPEISLTPQTVGRFYARFQASIAVLHSGLSAGERYDEWRRTLRGEVRIVVGARSAIFAPIKNLGIIVVDEEHDNSYKQSETPRYHARDVAIMRAHRSGAVCVLGSATPSLESFYNSECGKSVRLSLLTRATRAPLPKVHILDMRKENRDMGQVVLSRRLEEAVHERINKNEQVILLLNRRGYAPFVLCPQCGWVAECENCNVSLTYHSNISALRCHYCDYQIRQPELCGRCGFQPLIYIGTGTQKVEDYLVRTFNKCNVARMDADTTSGKGGHAKLLNRFAAGEIDIMIGTQMLAKGHDYPGVTLVGVINADTGLGHPDFRAAENVFQLLTQVAGRAGRGSKPGEVIIQTYRPNHYAILSAAQHDYSAFYTQEIAQREASGYPPFRRMVNFAVESEDPMIAERESVRLRSIIHNCIENNRFAPTTVLGPAPAGIRRLKKKYRWHIALLAKNSKSLNTLSRAIRDEFHTTAHKDAYLKIDLDPYGSY